MSLILDALNKADNERNQGDTPSLQSKHDAQSPFNGGHNAKLLYGLIAVLMTLAIVILYLLLSKDDSPAEATAPQAPASQAPAPAEQGVSTRSAAPPASPSSRYQQVKQDVIAKQYANAQPKQEIPNPQQAPASAQATSQTSPQTPAKAAAASPTQQTQTLTKQDLASLEKIAAIYEQSKQPEKVDPTPTPKPRAKPKAPSLSDFPLLTYIGDISYSQQKSIPSIMYTAHNYDENGASVTLNKTTYRKGQQIGSELFLEEIVEDGIVIRHRNLRFKMTALNSWVNM